MTTVGKKKINPWYLAAITIAFLTMCCVCLLAYPSSGSISQLMAEGPKAKYVVKGSAQSALITYFNETGGTEQLNANLPFEKKLSLKSGSAVSVVAQNSGTGTITCEIWINDELIKTSTSTAQYGVVTCSDFVY